MSTLELLRERALRLTGVDYCAYVAMRDSPGNDVYRMTYHDGVLWIMSPQYRHEKGARRIGIIVAAYADVTNLDCEPAGATTFRKGIPGEPAGHGKEGDETYYLGAVADRVADKDELDLGVDPPPSLWIEVDNYGESLGKLPLYASLGVPEVWQYRVRSRKLKFWRLDGDSYTEIFESIALPGLTPAMVLGLIDEARTLGQTRWLKWMLNDWFPKNRALFPDFTNRQP